jgi:O-antigen/teichoic acid export membrane protein
VLAQPLVTFLFGLEYQAAVPVLRILSWSIPLTFLNWAMMATVMALSQERRGSAYLLAGVLFCGVGNLVAIPLFGTLGAAVTTVLAEAAVFLVQWTLLRQSLPAARPLGQLAKPLWATLAMAAFAWLLRHQPLAYTVLAASMIYLAALIILRAVGPEEWALLQGLMRRKQVQGAPSR